MVGQAVAATAIAVTSERRVDRKANAGAALRRAQLRACFPEPPVSSKAATCEAAASLQAARAARRKRCLLDADDGLQLPPQPALPPRQLPLLLLHLRLQLCQLGRARGILELEVDCGLQAGLVKQRESEAEPAPIVGVRGGPEAANP